PTGFARGVRLAAGIVTLAGAALFGAAGQVLVALWLAILGAGLLGWIPWSVASVVRPYQKNRSRTSRVRAAFVEMELDHDTGAMRGRVTSGRYAGASLDTLEFSTLMALLSEFDQESRALLAAYLDRRNPGWREHAHSGTASGERAAANAGKMSEQEAY